MVLFLPNPAARVRFAKTLSTRIWSSASLPCPPSCFTQRRLRHALSNPDRTTLLLPLAANKAAAKSGDKKVAAKSGGKSSSISEKRKNDILQYLTDTSEASSTQIADAIGLQVSRTKMYLSELVSDGAVVAEESSRARKYRLKS